MLSANVSGIIKSSLIDGPGNRLVVFFQECNLNCQYCHNSHTIGLCNFCGLCVDNCPSDSLLFNETQDSIIHNEHTCLHCNKCIDNCPQSSSPFYRRYTIPELIAEISPVKDFISGITLSGGESLLQADFICEFSKSLKADDETSHLSIMIDSNGNHDKSTFDKVLPYIDGFMIDLKAYSSNEHLEITGHSNRKILDAIQYLSKQSLLHTVRVVIVSELNSKRSEVLKIISFLSTLSNDFLISIIKMRKHGIRDKYSNLMEPSDSDMEEVKRLFKSEEFDVDII